MYHNLKDQNKTFDLFPGYFKNFGIKGSYLFLLLSVLLVSSCGRSSTIEETYTPTFPYYIDMEKYFDNRNTMPLSTLGKELEYIALETSPDCSIDRISELWLNDSLIVVSTIVQVYLFDRSGKFIRKIGSYGRGPGEYSLVSSLNVDQFNNLIRINEMRRMHTFDFNGNFLSSFDYPFPSVNSLILDENRIMFHELNNIFPSEDQRYSWHIFDFKGNEIASFESNSPRNSWMNADTPLYMYEGTGHFKEFGTDTLFYFDESVVKPYAIFNAGKYRLEPEAQINLDNRDEFRDKIWIYDARENSDHIFLDLGFGLSASDKGIFNKSTGEFTILTDRAYMNDIDGGINFWPEVIIDDNIMIDFVEAFDLIQHLDSVGETPKNVNKGKYKEILDIKERINEFSNPVIMILK
jgi:hypothetical protein